MQSARFLQCIATTVFATAILCTIEATAQSHIKYDASAETVIKGTVETVTVPDAPRELVRITINTGTEKIEAALAPEKFLKSVECALATGDKITLTGVKVQADGKDLFLVRIIERKDDMYVFRSPTGTPGW